MHTWKSMVAAGMFTGVTGNALADVYSYVGSDKVLVLTNSKPQNQAVQVLVAEPAAPLQGGAPTAATNGLRTHSRFDGLIDAAASAFGIDSALLHAVISVESGYAAQARSKRGASGLMQLMPATARQFGVADVFDPAQNINGGARYLKYLLEKYDNRLDLVLAAYNAGEKALVQHGGIIPPFPETLRYITLVQARYLRSRQAQAAGQ